MTVHLSALSLFQSLITTQKCTNMEKSVEGFELGITQGKKCTLQTWHKAGKPEHRLRMYQLLITSIGQATKKICVGALSMLGSAPECMKSV